MELKRSIFSYFKSWKEKKQRKPLIIRGARQVGKTSSVLFFGKKNFDYVIHLNLEKVEHRRLFPDEVSLEQFKKIINLFFQKPIIAGKTLIFIDEIQESPHLINLLRFFYEEEPSLHVIAAGSLFEVKISQKHIPLPVGRVEFAYLYPLDFFEFLEAKGELKLLSFLREFDFVSKIPLGIHQRLLELFYEYSLTGGMPEAVKVYLESKNIEAVNAVYSSLLTSFIEDVNKYSSLAKSRYLSFVLEQAPLFAGLAITYEKFAGSSYRSREISEAFKMLRKAMIINQIPATKSVKLPLIPQSKKPPKLIFIDVGLVNFMMGIQNEFIKIKDLNDFYQGRIAEQIVAQTLPCSFINTTPNIFYWFKKTGSQAEVDFCLSYQGKIVGFEVKSGTAGRLRSSYEFLRTVIPSRVLRIYCGEFRREKNGLVSVPFYLLPRWQEVLEHMF